MLQKIRWSLSLIAVLVVVIVAFQNQDAVPLTILFFSGEYPLTLLLLGCSGVSFVLGCLMTAWRIRSRHKAQSARDSKAKTESNAKAKKEDTSAKAASPPSKKKGLGNNRSAEESIGIDQEAT
ncbi:LapA family protein [Rhodopirellula sp. JC740]|uniref:LapA family protein n=1 Tax=Rhodopirellula halodulae TaxID=2894198 RepID=A0ABS8NGI4_9BACT|nr:MULTISPECIES: LapA family protein [unclassified Rhodopirellula]MCC9642664.1 LapA family protein [Rhodopirellula sp. JC740]MCC9656037.1 LapA family protein [Rhodopirellula sp. JC737]